MMMLLKGFAITGVVAVAAGTMSFGAFAADEQNMPPAPDCPPTVESLPPALAGWAAKGVLLSAAHSGDLNTALVKIGEAATVTLHQNVEIAYLSPPERPPGSATYGGMLAVMIGKAGTYQISLSSGAWIDFLKNGAAASPSAHAPGPACTGIRKTVQFPMQPGRFVVQLSGNATPTIEVMVSPVP